MSGEAKVGWDRSPLNRSVRARKEAMWFHANHVSTSVSGDYYQAMFEASEDSTDPDSPYLIIQRQFEMPDGGKCYIETHNIVVFPDRIECFMRAAGQFQR